MNLSVVVVDDEPLIRSGLRAIIDAEPDLTVVGEAGDGAEVLPVVRRTGADVVLMDVRMPCWSSPPSRTTTTCTTRCAPARPGSC
jgi:YesN/AraC family two-component response regulator